MPPGGWVGETHDAVGEAYYVLAGSGTVTVVSGSVPGVRVREDPAAATAPIRAGDAIPIRIGESSVFANTGSEPLELFVMGVAKDAAAKTQLLSGATPR